MTDPVIVIGAGISGLAAATALRKRGRAVQVIETSDRPGGRAVTIPRPDGSGDRVDVGTQYFHSNYSRGKALLKDAGVTWRRLRGGTYFFDDLHPAGGFSTGHRFPVIRSIGLRGNVALFARGLARMLRHPIHPYAVTSYPGPDSLTALEAVTDPVERAYTLRALISVGALVEPEGQPGFDISYLHLVRLMRIILMTDYLVLDDGMAAVHTALAGRLDVSYATRAQGLLCKGSEDGPVTGVVLTDGRVLRASAVVAAVPPQALAELLPRDWTSEQAFLRDIPHPPGVIVTLFLDRPLKGRCWSFVFPHDPARLVSFCVDAARKSPAMVPSRRSALQAWICWPKAGDVAATTDPDLVRRVIAELSSFFPKLADRVDSSDVTRHAQAVPQCLPGHSERAQQFLAAMDRRDGLEVCGDFLSGGYVESALASTERAVARVLAQAPNRRI
ncbi:protoporphyrinogen/coproporphyrinogen oxidase [Thalassococcus sp. BH17M4-6]|uniref:protoporphyrinogen/coproporphyrinogen oxidase n=1 Tax=Thalassococcus sp. BH17M4-6 TaxID=3413148 RepID=UPI003BE5D064